MSNNKVISHAGSKSIGDLNLILANHKIRLQQAPILNKVPKIMKPEKERMNNEQNEN